MCKDFGEPDGARTDIKELDNDFIDIAFDNNKRSTNETDLRTRVIVGSKGSGKTVYLRRMKSRLAENPAVCITDIQREMPPTEYIIRFGQMFKAENVTEAWSNIWRLAILRSLVSHILKYKSRGYNQNLDQELVETLLEYEGKYFPKYRVARSVYTELKDLLQPNSFKSANDFYKFAFSPEWDDIKQIVSDLLRDRMPLYFFIDSSDDEYAHAPMYWMQCQKGLFYRIMRLLRENIYGNKLHAVICVRDNVLASVYRSEHRTRYMDSDHIKVLRWDELEIKQFLMKKLERLDDSLFEDPKGEHSLQNWLGLSQIDNPNRGIIEEISSYLIRHTRKLPRDIIVMGNRLIDMKMRFNNVSSEERNEKVREVVGNCARLFGDELIQICANQMMNNEMPNDAGRNQYSEVYTSSKEFRSTTSHKIHYVLQSLKDEELTWIDLVELEKLANDTIWKDCQLCNTLWQNGALGYITPIAGTDEKIFFDYDYTYFLLPRDKKRYILPSFMLDAIGIDIFGKHEQVIQGGPDNEL